MKNSSKYIADLVIVSAILLWTIFIIYYTPQKFIEAIGMHNGYILAFIMTVLGGIATITVISVYPPLVVLASGGLNPITLGIVAGLGLTIANSLFFYVGYKGRHYTKKGGKLSNCCVAANKWFKRRKSWQIYLVVLVYVAFSPLPNNALTASGGLFDFSFKKILVPLLIGNIILMSAFSYLGSVGVQIIP